MRLGGFLTKQSFILVCVMQFGAFNHSLADDNAATPPTTESANREIARSQKSDVKNASLPSEVEEQYQTYYRTNPYKLKLLEKIRRHEIKLSRMRERMKQREARLEEMRDELNQPEHQKLK